MYLGFDRELLELVRCQADGGKLTATGTGDGPLIRDGAACCTTCSNRYPFRDGILDLLAQQGIVDPVNEQERAARNTTRVTKDRSQPSFADRLEISSTLLNLEPLGGMVVVDFGCGWGRITQHLLRRSASVLAIDFSATLLDIFASHVDGPARLGLVLADATRIRLSPESCDRALSSQVLEHLRGAERRRGFFDTVLTPLKRGGLFVCTAYSQNILRRLKRRPADGVHENGIYFHCFTARELRDEFAPRFDLLSVHPIRVEFPILPRFVGTTFWLSRISEHLPILKEFGGLLLAQGRKR